VTPEELLNAEIVEMEKVRDLSGKCVELLAAIRATSKEPQFLNGNEDLAVVWTQQDMNRFRNKVTNRKTKIQEVTDGWPRV